MQSHSHNRRREHRGFTLIELVVVIVILAILAAVIVPRFMGRTEDAKISSAITQIASFKTAISMYNSDVSSFPATLDSLISAGEDAKQKWHGPYLDGTDVVPKDPWGNPYVYKHPGEHSPDFDIVSAGPDGQMGTADDIQSWNLKKQ